MKKKPKYKVVFLDRDGVLNKTNKKKYIGKIKDYIWIPGAKKALKLLSDLNYKIIIVTNQSGVARGLFPISDVHKLHKFLKNQCLENGIKIYKIFFCPYHPEGIIPKYSIKSNLRKPNNGMFKLAQKKINIDLKKSFMIGDQISDMKFAKKSKIKGYLFKKKNLFNFVKWIFKIKN